MSTLESLVYNLKKQLEALDREYKEYSELAQKHNNIIHTQTSNAKRKLNQILSDADKQKASAQATPILIRQSFETQVAERKKAIADFEYMCVSAAGNDKKLLQKYGAVPSGVRVCPDANALKSLYTKIMTDTNASYMKRTLKQDGFYAQKDMIKDFITGAAALISYYRDDINIRLPQTTNEALRKAKNSYISANEGADQDIQNANQKYESEMAQIATYERQLEQNRQDKLKELNQRKEKFFASDDVVNYVDKFKLALKDTGAFEEDWTDYSGDKVRSESMVIGRLRIPVHLEDQNLEKEFREAIGKGYLAGFSIPMQVHSNAIIRMYGEYCIFGGIRTDKGLMDSSMPNQYKIALHNHVQRIVLNKMRSNPMNTLSIYLADPIDRGKNFGLLNDTMENNLAIGIRVSNSKDGIREMLQDIVKEIDVRSGKMGACESIFEYNKINPNGDTLKEIVLVICDASECLEKEALENFELIWNNAVRCGIHVIITCNKSLEALKKEASQKPYEGNNWNFIQEKDTYIVKSLIMGTEIIRYKTQYTYILNDKVLDCHKTFISYYREHFKDSLKINNLFMDRIKELHVEDLTSDQIQYGKAINGIRLPIMIDTRNNKVSNEFVIGTENSQHTLITGGTGSGKSRLLQMIITSIVMNYHPDDVELWLIDCKQVEFKKFMDLRPPHVRMVSLERTKDFTYAFLDHLVEFAKNRTRLFTEANVTDIKAYRKFKNDPYCMPRVVIIIDEFHAITQNVNMDMKYRQILEDALSEYRNLGISFIFSDQSVSGLNGLTEKGRQQLHNRVAMKNSINEMRETLQLLHENYSLETLMDMEKSEGIGDFWWNKQPNVRYKTVKLDDEPEKRILCDVIDKHEEPKQDTKVWLIDGNERIEFNQGNKDIEATVTMPTRGDIPNPLSGLTFTVGIPTTLQDVFSFRILQKYNHNILVAGRDSLMVVDIVASIIKSAILANGVRMILFADPMDDKYQIVQSAIAKAGLAQQLEIYDSYSDICQVINDLHSKIKTKKPLEKKTVVVWLGIGDLYDEFCVSPAKSQDMFSERDAERAKKNGGFSVKDTNLAIADPQLIEIAKQMGLTVEQALGFLSGGESEATPCNEVEEDLCYNANQDMFDLFAMGGKYGVFNVVTMEHSYEARRVKGFDTDQFMHKIALCMPREESMEWGLRTAASELVEGLTALYTDGINQHVFKPYVNEK